MTTAAASGTPAAPVTPDFADRTDFENADRGFVAGPSSTTITTDDGRMVWDFAGTAFLEGTARTPSTRACGGSPSCAPAPACTG